MSNLKLAIIDGIKNDHKDVELTIKNIPSGQTLIKAWLTVVDDAEVVLLATDISPTLTAFGQITDTGADGTGVIVFLLTPAQTSLFSNIVRYYDVQVKLDPSNKVTTVEKGEVRFDTGHTAATS